MGCFVIKGSNPGLLVPGTIDICKRENVSVPNPKGGFSSVYSQSAGWPPFADTGKVKVPMKIRKMLAAKNLQIQILYPLVIFKNGRWAIVSSGEAQKRATGAGLHLGVFDTPAHAESYGNRLHLQQEGAQKPAGRRVIVRIKGRRYNCRRDVRNGQVSLNDCRPV